MLLREPIVYFALQSTRWRIFQFANRARIADASEVPMLGLERRFESQLRAALSVRHWFSSRAGDSICAY